MQKGRVWMGLAIAATVAITLVTGGKTAAGESRMIQIQYKLDGIAGQTFEQYRMQGGEAALQSYQSRGYEIMGKMVRVVVELEDLRGVSTDVSRSLVAQAAQYWGGRVEAEYSHLVRVLLPIEALGDLSLSPNVRLIRTPLKPHEAGVTSEGVARSGANVFQGAPSFGGDSNVKIAVLDSGFKGYSSLLGSELPSSVQTKNYRTDGNFEYSLHGSACAEIVHDMAPGAEIYLVAVNDDVGFHQAVDWLIQEKVDVISCSLVWMCDAGAGDGTGPICEDVKKADTAGIVWVQAMGNYGKQYWAGRYYPSPKNPNNHQFGLGPHNYQYEDVLAFKASGPFEIYLSWDDWGTWDGKEYSGASQGYGVRLLQALSVVYIDGVENATVFAPFTGFDAPQTPGRKNLPVEKSGVLTIKSPTNWWGLQIYRNYTNRDVNFRLYILGTDIVPIDLNTKRGSLCIPAESRQAVSVSGVNTADVYYSLNCHGPVRTAEDSLMKPDLLGYSAISTLSMGVFEGTSAAAAHVAGAFGLLKSKLPFSSTDLKQVMKKRAIQFANNAYSNGWHHDSGYGRLNLLKK